MHVTIHLYMYACMYICMQTKVGKSEDIIRIIIQMS